MLHKSAIHTAQLGAVDDTGRTLMSCSSLLLGQRAADEMIGGGVTPPFLYILAGLLGLAMKPPKTENNGTSDKRD